MLDTDPPPPRAARLRTLCLRCGAVFTAVLACTAVPALAAAHAHRPALARRASRRLAKRRLSVRRCLDVGVQIAVAPRRETDDATLCLLNRERAHFHLPALRLSRRLDDSAQTWTNTMVHDHSFSHGSDFGARISATGFDWSQIGENIADGYQTPAGAVRAWMASTGHCQNILSPEFREVGAGFDDGSAAGGFQDGTWTLDLGLLMRQRAPSENWRPAEGCPY
jgi:uncharacterized protein YkwD